MLNTLQLSIMEEKMGKNMYTLTESLLGTLVANDIVNQLYFH